MFVMSWTHLDIQLSQLILELLWVCCEGNRPDLCNTETPRLIGNVVKGLHENPEIASFFRYIFLLANERRLKNIVI